MELRHLRYFVAVAEEQSFSRAALKLHIAQPPLSQQIRGLEEELGVQLLRRNSKGVELTAAGKHFLEEAMQILTRADRAQYLARRVAQGQAGSLELACGPIASLVVLPPILAHFRVAHPGVDVKVRDMLTEPALEALLGNSVDAIFGLDPFEPEGVSSEIIYRDELTLAVPDNHRLASVGLRKLRDCDREPFVVIARSTSSRAYNMALGICRRGGFHPHIVHEVDSVPSQLMLISAGFGVGFVPTSVKIISQGVSFLRLPRSVPAVNISMGWRSSDKSPILRSLTQIVRKQRDTTRGGAWNPAFPRPHANVRLGAQSVKRTQPC